MPGPLSAEGLQKTLIGFLDLLPSQERARPRSKENPCNRPEDESSSERGKAVLASHQVVCKYLGPQVTLGFQKPWVGSKDAAQHRKSKLCFEGGGLMNYLIHYPCNYTEVLIMGLTGSRCSGDPSDPQALNVDFGGL